ncbi:unnamed protein product [Coregonus sp. 'balchen']|nr:unnamed protein product [Coregonus sp. 'balchen']
MEIAQVKKPRPQEQTYEINVLQAKKKFEILDSRLDQLVIDSAMEKRDLEHKHATIQQRPLSISPVPNRDFSINASPGRHNPLDGAMPGRAQQTSAAAFPRRTRGPNRSVPRSRPYSDGGRKRWLFHGSGFCERDRVTGARFGFKREMLLDCTLLKMKIFNGLDYTLDALTVVVEDLRLCSVKPCEDGERRFCFERLDRTASPSTSSIDSASEPRGEKGGRGGEGRGESILHRVQSLPGNELCCDCSQAAPCWASINLGLMCELGNNVINHIYEGACEELGVKKPGPSSPRQEKEAWIKAKYVERRFLKKMRASDSLVEGERKSRPWSVKKCQRHNGSMRGAPKTRRKYRHDPGLTSPGNLSAAAAAAKLRRDSLFCPDEMDNLFSYFDTGNGTRIECESEEEESSGEVEIEQEAGSDPESPYPMAGALPRGSCSTGRHGYTTCHSWPRRWRMGQMSATAKEKRRDKEPALHTRPALNRVCEFLLQNGADVNQRDMRGRGPLHHATYLGHTGLRLARMNEEMREAEGPFGQPVM